MGCAWVPFKGRIAPGMLADLVVLGDDISRVPVEEVCDIPVAMTIVGGVVEHEASL
jgi:predicted amidohydrolase YtcJ